MIYFRNSIPSPSVTMWAVNPATEGVLKVTIDRDTLTYGHKPGVHISTEKLEGLSGFVEDFLEIGEREFEAHFIEAYTIQSKHYLQRTIRTIPADL